MKTTQTFSSYRYFGIFRFVLATMVMFQHFSGNAAPMAFTLLTWQYEVGSLAVLAFFSLSGFVIVEAADVAYQRRPMAFMSNRLIRVFPHFVIAVTLSLVLQGIFFSTGTLHMDRMAAHPLSPDFSPLNILLNYIDIVPPTDRFIGYEFIPIAWAVRVEMVFYIAVALCLVLARTNKFKITFPAAMGAISAMLIPAFFLAVYQRGPLTFGFLPYFTFGGSLYYVLKGERTARIVNALSLVGMVWQFLAQPAHHPMFGYARDVPAQLAILCTLIAALIVLATIRRQNFRRQDNQIGNITYPLYMYHLAILIPVTSLFTNSTYGVFFFGMLASVAFAVMMAKIVDPMIDRYRDRIRGQRLIASGVAVQAPGRTMPSRRVEPVGVAGARER